MRVFEQAKGLFCFLTLVGTLAGCAEEKASLSLLPRDAGTPPTSTPDGGSAATAGDGGAGASAEVTISEGKVRGVKDGDRTVSFLGIPYAKPPIGDLRWKAPQPPAKWSAPLVADKFGKRCAQIASAVLQNAASADEDCLYLNVWTPDLKPKTLLPVMFWIHGGGNVNGSASEPVPFTGATSPDFYKGRKLAEKDVVVVTFNYRLGVFGFFSHPELAAEEGGVPGNQGLLDQTAALEWVKKNIKNFGGDPEKVTIFGESAGSLDVCFHVASPKSRGLFSGAISQSGGCTTKHPDVAAGEQSSASIAGALGCEGDDQLACLRDKQVSDFLTFLDPSKTPTPALKPSFAPIVDGEGGFLPDQPRALFQSGDVAQVPYILGSNNDEGTLFVSPTAKLDTEADLIAELKKTSSRDPTPLLALYPADQFASTKERYARIAGDSRLVCSTYDSAVQAAEAGLSVYTYNFDIPVVLPDAIASMLPVPLGATHGAELAYVFGTSPTVSAEGPAKSTSDTIQQYWTNFAKTGDPNGGDLVEWPTFTGPGAGDKRLSIKTEEYAVLDGFRAAECAVFRSIYDAQFTTPAP
jgi:para-nitrobenzyl esterase